jgi:glycosyltransferase involved in cell wall biosynthesis
MNAPEEASTPKLPAVSVVVRSYKRRECLLRILEALREQDHPEFEVIVLEQSGFTAEQRAQLDETARADPRLKIVYSEPLGVGGSRDTGWRLAKNEIVLSIDDDDLPLGSGFVSGHARNYLDPTIIGVTCRHVYSPDEVCGYNRARARRSCLRYNFFGYPHAFCRFDERIESVHWVHGSGGSLRKSVIERIGGWDPRATDHDEHPLCLPLRKSRLPGERLVFDPSIRLLRRKDVPGGAQVRFGGSHRTYQMWIRYYHGLVFKHHPVRAMALYPVFPLASAFSAVRWIWTDSLVHRSVGERLFDSVKTLALNPLWYAQELWRLVRNRKTA